MKNPSFFFSVKNGAKILMPKERQSKRQNSFMGSKKGKAQQASIEKVREEHIKNMLEFFILNFYNLILFYIKII